MFAFRPLETKFEIPGGTKIEGCQVVAFREDLPDTIRDVFRHPSSTVAGRNVVVVADSPRPPDIPGVPPPSGLERGKRNKTNEDTRRISFAMLSNRALIAATLTVQLEQAIKALEKQAPSAIRTISQVVHSRRSAA